MPVSPKVKSLKSAAQIRLEPSQPTPTSQATRLTGEFPHELPVSRIAWFFLVIVEHVICLWVLVRALPACAFMSIHWLKSIGVSADLMTLNMGASKLCGLLNVLYILAILVSPWRRLFRVSKYYMLLLGIAVLCTGGCGIALECSQHAAESTSNFMHMGISITCILLVGGSLILRYICACRYRYISFTGAYLQACRQRRSAPAQAKKAGSYYGPAGILAMISAMAIIIWVKAHTPTSFMLDCTIHNLDEAPVYVSTIDNADKEAPHFSLICDKEYRGYAASYCSYGRTTPDSELVIHWHYSNQPEAEQESRVTWEPTPVKKNLNMIFVLYQGTWHLITTKDTVDSLTRQEVKDLLDKRPAAQ